MESNIVSRAIKLTIIVREKYHCYQLGLHKNADNRGLRRE